MGNSQFLFLGHPLRGYRVKRLRHKADQSSLQVPRLRMRGATPPLPSMSPWRTQGQVYFRDAPRITKYFRKARHKYESRIHMVNYICIYRNPVEIQTPTYKKTVGRSMTKPPPVLSPKSILPLPLPHCTFIPARKTSARLSKCSKLPI
jgi:hypothetical protein